MTVQLVRKVRLIFCCFVHVLVKIHLSSGRCDLSCHDSFTVQLIPMRRAPIVRTPVLKSASRQIEAHFKHLHRIRTSPRNVVRPLADFL
ncbi:hypothetical protein DEU56DRAFT_793213 [Suillus clintonianus]|uniref:uncharacterized protein n=1 Tax=Suillus clintonianus TaxID=1904413 RepID=UPI001B860C25|nr:uncharacterized protein DEU56DRAFT_793213 [Suillus clintonianus]KAG2143048.1 hypothetical protein DEU56DRAFT_793213 [Suillus clintonianus]